MKKLLSISALLMSAQMLMAHPSTTHHTHDSFMGQWAWYILPAAAVAGLIIWRVSKAKAGNKAN